MSPRTKKRFKEYTESEYTPDRDLISINRAINPEEDDHYYLMHGNKVKGNGIEIFRAENYLGNILGIMEAYLEKRSFPFPACSFTKKKIITEEKYDPNYSKAGHGASFIKPCFIVADIKQNIIHGIDGENISSHPAERDFL